MEGEGHRGFPLRGGFRAPVRSPVPAPSAPYGRCGQRVRRAPLHADVCARFRNPSCGSMRPNRDVEYASVTPVGGNAPVCTVGSPDMSDRGGAMRGWTGPVRYGLIRPLSVWNADARVLSDAVRPGREAGCTSAPFWKQPSLLRTVSYGRVHSGLRRFPQAFVRIRPSGLRSVRRSCRYCRYR